MTSGSGTVVRWLLSEGLVHELNTQSTWLTADGVSEVARRARLGQKMKGMGRVYDHVTPEMRRQLIEVLEARWRSSLRALRPEERAGLVSWFPHVQVMIDALPRDAA